METQHFSKFSLLPFSLDHDNNNVCVLPYILPNQNVPQFELVY